MEELSLIEKWKANIKMAETFMKPFRDQWESYIKYYFGKHYETLSDEERIVVNLIPRHIKVVLSRTYFKDPYITVNPRNEGAREVSKLTEIAVNYEQEEIGQKSEIRDAIFDALLLDFGIVKLGYSFKTEVEQQSEYVKEDRIFCRRVSPADMGFDPEASKLSNCKWMYQIVLRSLDEVKENENYKNTKDLKATATLSKNLLEKLDEKEKKSDYLKRVKLYEIWDIENGKLIVLADGHDEILREVDMDEISEMEGFPFKFLCFDRVPGFLFGRSMITDIIPQQDELNLTRTALANHWKQIVPMFQIPVDGISDTEKKKLEEGKAFSLVEVREGVEIRPIVYPPLAAEAIASGEIQKADMREQAGGSEQQRGGAIPGVSTATEASIIERNVALMSDENLGMVEDFCTEIARGETQLMRQHYDKERFARIKGDAGFEFIKYTKEDLQGEYDISVRAGSTLPINKEVRQKLSIDSLNVLGHPAFEQYIDKGILVQRVAEDMDMEVAVKPRGAGIPSPLGEEAMSAMQTGGITPEEYEAEISKRETIQALLPRLLSRGAGPPTPSHFMSAAERR